MTESLRLKVLKVETHATSSSNSGSCLSLYYWLSQGSSKDLAQTLLYSALVSLARSFFCLTGSDGKPSNNSGFGSWTRNQRCALARKITQPTCEQFLNWYSGGPCYWAKNIQEHAFDNYNLVHHRLTWDLKRLITTDTSTRAILLKTGNPIEKKVMNSFVIWHLSRNFSESLIREKQSDQTRRLVSWR